MTTPEQLNSDLPRDVQRNVQWNCLSHRSGTMD